MSLVELMVGVTVGLFVVAGAATLVATQLNDNRQLLGDTQLQQDLRAAADIMTRELRRAGYWNLAQNVVWNPATGNAQPDPYWVNLSVSSGQVMFNYRRPDNTAGPFGYQLYGGAIRTNLGALAGWQDLTDKNVVTITDFQPTLTQSTPVRLPCEKPCPSPYPPGSGADYCWPTLALNTLKLSITGHPKNDASAAATRTVEALVRFRNDKITFNAYNSSGGALACPS